MEHVFVYGTLLSGLHNHYLLKDSLFIGYFESKQKMSMFCSGIPYVFTRPAKYSIKGEIYEVDDTVLARLDSLEGHPHWYKRSKKWFTNGVLEKRAWIYIMPPENHLSDNCVLLKNGDFRSYRNGLL